MRRLAGRVAVVTGSASGIGRATARLFAREGAKVAVVDVDVKGGQETVQLIQDDGGRAAFYKTDVTKSAEVKRMAGSVAKKFGAVTVLHNNAGGWDIETQDSVTDDTEEEWDRWIALNLKSVFLVSREFIPGMIKAGGGSIINTVSINSFMPGPRSASYTAAKAGGYTLTKEMALDYANKNIRVNGIAPGEILTPIQIRTMDAFPDPEAGIESLRKSIPMGRLGKPEEIAYVALWLASDEASYLTGEIIVADGGLTVGRQPYPVTARKRTPE